MVAMGNLENNSMNLQTETKSLKGVQLIDCPGCDRQMPDGKYICSRCEINNNYRSKTPPLMTSKPEHTPARSGAGAGCYRCGKEELCHERMSLDQWLLCEIPDALDFLVLGKLNVDDLKKYLSVNGKTSSRWNNKDGGIFDE